MINTFAVVNYAENYDFEAQLDRARAYISTQNIKLPNANAFAIELNAQSRKSAVVDAIAMQYIALCYFELDQSTPVILIDGAGETPSEFTARFAEKLDATRFDTIKLSGFIPCEALQVMYAAKTNQQNLSNLAFVCGADKIVSVVAVFELQGSKFLLCSDVVSYDGKWFMLHFGGNIGSLLSISPYTAGIVPMNVPDSDEIFNGELESLIIPIN